MLGVLLAKSPLPTEEISVYEALMILSNLMVFFWVTGGQNSLLQYFPKLYKADKGKALFNAFLVFFALALVAAGILYFLKDLILHQFTNFDDLPYWNYLCAYVVFVTPSYLVHIYYLLLKQYKSILVYGVFAFVGQVFAICLPLFLGYSLELSFIALLILAIARFFWCISILVKNAQWQLDLSFLKNYLLLITPLMLHILIGQSVEYVDAFIVTSQFTDDKMLAIFRYGAKELPLSLLLVGALITALIPKVSEAPKEGLALIKKETDALSRWLYPLSMALMLLSPLLFPIFYNEDFRASAQIFNIYLLILSSRILLPQVVIMSHHKNYFLVVSAIIETIINISLSLYFVQFWGLKGIAFASVIAYLVNKINMIVFNNMVLNIRLKEYVSISKYLIYNISLFICYFITEYIYQL